MTTAVASPAPVLQWVICPCGRKLCRAEAGATVEVRCAGCKRIVLVRVR